MYAPDITARQVEEASRRQGWPLVYHSSSVIASALSHFDDLIHEETQELVRPLTTEESQFVKNERRLCALDFVYWLTHYGHIVDWQKRDVIFSPNVAQRMILDIWSDLERRGLAIILMGLKARQLGYTSVTEMAVGHRVQFRKRTKAVVASADPKKTVQMGEMIKFCWDEQPWWLMPSQPDDKIEKGMIVEFKALNSSILIQAGNQFHGVARGQTPNVFHLSELSSWDNAEEDVDASLLRAVHETPDVFGVLESTALGRDNWWAKTWAIAKEDWPRGRSRICPMFLPWFVGTDIYPTATELRARPIPIGWIPSDRTIHHAERAREYVRSNPLLLKHLAKGDTDWQMPRAQMWFYEVERETAVKKKALNKFLSEMPADDQEAFQTSNISVVDQDVILLYRDRIRQPIGVYAITGPWIQQSVLPPSSQLDPRAPPITVNVSGACRSSDVYQFLPLRFEGYPGFDPMFKLFLYELPEEECTYGIGVDTSDGIGEDWSVLEGFRKGDADRSHAQVCEYASPYVKAQQLWPMALAIASFFSTFRASLGRRQQCRVCVECKGNGELVQDEMKKRGWWNFHPWKRYDNRVRLTNDKVHKEGVFTNESFRMMMMDTLLTAVDEGTIDIGSPWFVDELSTLERGEVMSSARAAYSAHDDRVMALGFPLFSLTVDDRPRQQTYRRSVPMYLPDAIDEEAARTPYAIRPVPDQARDLTMKVPGVYRRSRGAMVLESRVGYTNGRRGLR